MKVKIVFLVSTLQSGGPTSVLFNLLKCLDKTLFSPFVITLSPEPANSRWNDFQSLGIKIISLNLDRVTWFLKGPARLKAELNKLAPHIIHSHSLRPDRVSARHLKGFIRISTVHGNLEAAYADTYGEMIGRSLAEQQLNSIGVLEKKVACSKAVYDHYKALWEDLIYIQNGVDTEIYSVPSNLEKAGIRKRLGLSDNRTTFISVGALTKLKDPETVIKGFLGSGFPENSQLIVLGTGPLEKQLRLYRENMNITFTGFVTNVRDYLMASDYFISASTSEGLPNTVMEALACGLPVCLSDIKPHLEFFNESSPGFSFKKGSYQSLSNAIDKILSADRLALQQNCRTLIEKEFNAVNMTRKYQDLYLSLIETK